MEFCKKNIRYVYSQLIEFIKINLIVKDKEQEAYINIEEFRVPRGIKEEEAGMLDYFQRNIPEGEQKSVYYYETSLGMKYLGMGIYNLEEYMGHIILGPYLNANRGEGDIAEILGQKGIEIREKRVVIEFYRSLPEMSIREEMTLGRIAYTLLQVGDMGIRSILPDEPNRVGIENQAQITKYYTTERAMLRAHYEAEQKMLYYVNQGDEKRALKALSDLNMDIVRRLKGDRVRNFKDVILVFNGLIRQSIASYKVDMYQLYKVTADTAIYIGECDTMTQLQVLLRDMIRAYCEIVNETKNLDYSPLVVKVIQYISCNFEEKITLSSLAKEFYVHPNYLSRRFKVETGEQLSEYINRVRIGQAKLLLKQKYVTIADVAYAVGYNDEKYFSKIFKKYNDKTPSEYRSS